MVQSMFEHVAIVIRTTRVGAVNRSGKKSLGISEM